MNYAIAHASVGVSVCLTWNEGAKKPKLVLLGTTDEKEAFIESLVKGDVVYTEMGGGSDRLALACYIRGAQVMRIPVFELGLEDESEPLEFDEEMEIEVSDEGNGSKLVEKRKVRAQACYVMACSDPSRFYPILVNDLPILRLIVLWKGFYLMQRTRIATHLRLLAVYRDLYLVDAATSSMSEEEYILDSINKDKSFKDLPPEARKTYLAEIKSGDCVMEAVTEQEKILLKRIGKQLNEMSIYNNVFKEIKGCGVTIAARMIGTIGDIRRFEALPNLRAYLGLHHFEDGSRARRVKGRQSNWSQVGRQGCYQFAEQVAKTPAGGSQWRELLDKRRGYELFKLLKGFGAMYVPTEFRGRKIDNVNDVTFDDLEVLLCAIDGLRGMTEFERVEGKKKIKIPYDEYLLEKYGKNDQLFDRVIDAYDDGFENSSVETKAKLKGVKGRALDKAKRYVQQRFVKHIDQAWRKAI